MRIALPALALLLPGIAPAQCDLKGVVNLMAKRNPGRLIGLE